MKITLCMVLKNEAKTIRHAVESVMPVLDKALISIDEATTDKTKEEIEKVSWTVPLTLTTHKFENDFSKLRNSLLERVNTDFVLILDGHEYIDPNSLMYIEELKSDTKNEKKYDIFDFNVIDMNIQNVMFQQPRLFRNHIRYEFPIHNLISQTDHRIAMPQIYLYHNQPDPRLKERQAQRQKMNIPGLLHKVKMTRDPRSMFYLANTYFELGDFDSALLWHKKYQKVTKFHAEKYSSKIYVATIYDKKKKYKECEEVLLSCFEDNISLNAHLLALGELKFKVENYAKAAEYFRMATSYKQPYRYLIINKTHYTWYPWLRLAHSYAMMNYASGVQECIRKGKQLAPDLKEFYELEEALEKQTNIAELKKKGIVYAVGSIGSFIKPLLGEINKFHFLMFEAQFNPDNAEQAHVIFCEWADHNAIAVSNFEGPQKKILRVHAYEAFSQYPNNINFEQFDKIIFVADHIKNVLFDRIGMQPDDKKGVVIPNGVDLQKFDIPKGKKPNNKIAWAGFITNKKGAVLLMTLANELKDFEFHVCGSFQEPDVEILFRQQKPKNLILYPWQNDLNKFFADKTYILNTSPREGCPVSILEGMAAGLKPLIYNWIGAKQIFNGYTWESVSDLRKLIDHSDKTYHPRQYREVIEKQFDQKDQLNLIRHQITTLLKGEQKDGQLNKVEV